MEEFLVTWIIYGVIAFALTGFIYALVMALGIYSILLLVVLVILTAASFSFLLKRGGLPISDAWAPGLFVPTVVFVAVSVVLTFFINWAWIALPALMYVIYINIGYEKVEDGIDRIARDAKEAAEGARAIQGKPTSPFWGTPFYAITRFCRSVSRDIVRTVYVFSLCALYVCTTMIIVPFSLPLYIPLAVWAIFLVTLLLIARKEEVVVSWKRLRKRAPAPPPPPPT